PLRPETPGAFIEVDGVVALHDVDGAVSKGLIHVGNHRGAAPADALLMKPSVVLGREEIRERLPEARLLALCPIEASRSCRLARLGARHHRDFLTGDAQGDQVIHRRQRVVPVVIKCRKCAIHDQLPLGGSWFSSSTRSTTSTTGTVRNRIATWAVEQPGVPSQCPFDAAAAAPFRASASRVEWLTCAPR